MKKTSLSRILSIAIILCMAVALLPATVICAGAADAGYTIVYDFIDNYAEGTYSKDSVTVQFYTPTVNLVDSYEKSNGFWKFATSASGLYIDHQYAPSSAWNNGLLAYFNADGRDWYAIKINVPVAGTYMASIGTIATSGHETNLEVYMLDGAATQEEIASSIEAGTGKIGEVNCTSGGYSALDSERRELSSKELSAGEHIVAFHAKNGKSAKIWSFVLKSGNGIVPMGATLNVSKSEIVANGTDSAEISVSKLYMSDTTLGTSDDIAAITFESSDNEILSVSGSTVKALSAGNAKVYAKSGDRIIGEAAITAKGKAPVSISFVDGAITGEKGSNPSTWTVTDNAFSIVLDKTKPGDGTQLSGVGTLSGYSLVKLHTGWLEWPARSLADTSFTIKKSFDFPGYYSVKHLGATWYAASLYSIYINDEYAGDYNFYAASAGSYKLGSEKTLNTIYIPSGDVEISFRTRHRYYSGGYSYLLPIMLTLTPAEAPAISAVETEGPETLEVGASADLTAKVKMADGTYRHFGFTGAGVVPTTGNIVKVESSSPAVEVSNVVFVEPSSYQNYTQEIDSTEATYTLTAKEAGSAVITVTAIVDGDKTKTATYTVTVPDNAPGEEVESPTVAFTADAEAGGTVTDKGEVKQIAIGGSVTVEATANDGYTFAYWRNAGGKHLSSNARETFKVNTNTAVIAVFDKAVEESDTTVPVYFYNENGSLITKKSVTKGTDFATAAAGVSKSLTGKIFESWSIDNSFIINEPTYAVAQYTADPTEYSVTVGGTPVATGAYGEKATVTGSESFSYWKLGDNIVSYNKAYSFYIWGNVTLEEVTGEEASAAPTIAINKQGENYFISYNTPTGYTLLEAGIVFGQSGSTPKIDSFYSKAVSELNNGQFTSKSGDGSETVARGYIVFRDNSDSSVRVIYAD